MFIDKCFASFLFLGVEWVDFGHFGENPSLSSMAWLKVLDGGSSSMVFFSKTSMKLAYGQGSLALGFFVYWTSSIANMVFLIG